MNSKEPSTAKRKGSDSKQVSVAKFFRLQPKTLNFDSPVCAESDRIACETSVEPDKRKKEEPFEFPPIMIVNLENVPPQQQALFRSLVDSMAATYRPTMNTQGPTVDPFMSQNSYQAQGPRVDPFMAHNSYQGAQNFMNHGNSHNSTDSFVFSGNSHNSRGHHAPNRNSRGNNRDRGRGRGNMSNIGMSHGNANRGIGYRGTSHRGTSYRGQSRGNGNNYGNGQRNNNRNSNQVNNRQARSYESDSSAGNTAETEMQIETFYDIDIAEEQSVWWIDREHPTKFFKKSQNLAIQFLLHNLILTHNRAHPEALIEHRDICHIAIIGGCALLTATNVATKNWLLSAWTEYQSQEWDGEIICRTMDYKSAKTNFDSPFTYAVRVWTLDNEANKSGWKQVVDETRSLPLKSENISKLAGSEGAQTINGDSYAVFDALITPNVRQALLDHINMDYYQIMSISGNGHIFGIRFIQGIVPNLSEIHPGAIADIADTMKKSTDPRRKLNKSKTYIMNQLKHVEFLVGILSLDANHTRIDLDDTEDTLNNTIIPTDSSGKRQTPRGSKKDPGSTTRKASKADG